MIPFASQRASGQDLATHLQNAYDNEMVEVAHLRGAIANDLHGAFKEWEVQAATLTKCKEYLYSLSINPDPEQGPLTRDQYIDYIGRVEKKLGLDNQPRAVVFHSKYGREHCHVVWSRINAEKEKAVHLAYDHDKLMRVTREFARDHGLTLPEGYFKSRQVGQIPQHVLEQQRRTGQSTEDHREQVTDAWRHSDTPRAFVNALAQRGYMLAAGRRNDYIVVDFYGDAHSLSRMVNDKTIRVKQIRDFLGERYPLGDLPNVAEAQKLVAAHRKLMEQSIDEDIAAAHLDELKHSQQERRQSVEKERQALKLRQQDLRLTQQTQHRAQRDKLRSDHLAKTKAIRLERSQNNPKGLAEFLGRISGVNLLRDKLHRYQDARRTREHLEQVTALKSLQTQEKKSLALRLKIQIQVIGQKVQSLEKIEKRELSALMRDLKRDQRVCDRGEDGFMPSLTKLVERTKKSDEKPVPDLMAEFARAQQTPCSEVPDLMSAFEIAAKNRREEKETGSERGLGNTRPPGVNPRENIDKDHEQGRGR